MRVRMKQRKALSGVQTMGSPRTLKLVLMMTGQPVRSSKALIVSQDIQLSGSIPHSRL